MCTIISFKKYANKLKSHNPKFAKYVNGYGFLLYITSFYPASNFMTSKQVTSPAWNNRFAHGRDANGIPVWRSCEVKINSGLPYSQQSSFEKIPPQQDTKTPAKQQQVVVQNRWFAYRSCYFGRRWAVLVCTRLSLACEIAASIHLGRAWLVHVYVDDGRVLLESRAAPFWASSVLLFLVALGVPLSWEKLWWCLLAKTLAVRAVQTFVQACVSFQIIVSCPFWCNGHKLDGWPSGRRHLAIDV